MQTDHASPVTGPAAESTPEVLTAWLRSARTGGVRLVEKDTTRLIPWSRVREDVDALAARLAERGVRRGRRIGIRGHNSYEWLALDLALLQLGAVPVAVPVPDFKGTSNADVAARYGLAAVFAGKESRSPADGPEVAPLEQVLTEVAVEPIAEPPAPEGKQVRVSDREVFTLAFSSGTAGRVKCLLLAWPGVQALVEAQSAAYPCRSDDRIMIALPLSTFQQRYLCYLAIRNGCEVVITTAARMLPTLPLTKPTIMLGPPNFYEFVEKRYRNLDPARRQELDERAALAERMPEAEAFEWRRSVFSEFHDMYGGSLRLALVGSAPVRPEMLDFFTRAGFELYQIYGMTEIGYLTWNRREGNRAGSVGTEVYPDTVRIAPDGEVLVQHQWHLCVGYEGESPEDTAAVFRAADTIATGDIGEFDSDGYLHLKGRKKNIIITTGGHKIQIEDLEAELCKPDSVHQAALFPVEDGVLAAAAFYEGPEERTRAAVLGSISQLNTRLGAGLQIRRLALVAGALTPESPLLNRNLKINREAVKAAVSDQLAPL
ncbi:AMP-binding protein [Kitasatospora sp. RB6PN24]|uniref:AMP-binding protein n=1 Tax=Kitasatospora humi TaxID=2893891 RepID=UPI001E4D517A|nr:AMP-binding protein [Kitasatospora humi]MCC9306074.1 AMP-binding protein [Kitasatospora humi]